MDLITMNSSENIRRLTGEESMDYRKMLRAIPRSYEDFVNSTADWMEQDISIRDAILNLLNSHPESTPSDVLEVLCECLGIGEPLELVEDEEESLFVTA